MAFSPPTPLSDADKLRALRQLDQFRDWRSLDDQRYCLVCGRIVTGQQIQVTAGAGGNGKLRLSCPTEQCNSIPMDWVLPTDENLALANAATSKVRSVSDPVSDDHPTHQLPTSQLSKFAMHFRRAFLV